MLNSRFTRIFLTVILFVTAVFLDYGYNKFKDIFIPQFQFTPLHVYKFVASLLWAAMVFGIAWYVLSVKPRSPGVAAFLLVSALLLLSLTFILELSPLLGPFMQPTQIIRMRLADIFSSELSLTVHTAAIMAVIGLVLLLPVRLFRLTEAPQDQT